MQAARELEATGAWWAEDAWAELTSGRARVVDRLERDGRWLLVLRRAPSRTERVLTERQVDVLERLAAGASYCEIGFELGLELSTVATHTTRALTMLRLRRIELPMLVVGAPRALPRGYEEAVVQSPVVDAALVPELSAAERDVVRRVLLDRSNRAIASERRTSERTVANQLAALFRKLHVRSRLELAALVAARAARGATRARRLTALA